MQHISPTFNIKKICDTLYTSYNFKIEDSILIKYLPYFNKEDNIQMKDFIAKAQDNEVTIKDISNKILIKDISTDYLSEKEFTNEIAIIQYAISPSLDGEKLVREHELTFLDLFDDIWMWVRDDICLGYKSQWLFKDINKLEVDNKTKLQYLLAKKAILSNTDYSLLMFGSTRKTFKFQLVFNYNNTKLLNWDEETTDLYVAHIEDSASEDTVMNQIYNPSEDKYSIDDHHFTFIEEYSIISPVYEFEPVLNEAETETDPNYLFDLSGAQFKIRELDEDQLSEVDQRLHLKYTTEIPNDNANKRVLPPILPKSDISWKLRVDAYNLNVLDFDRVDLIIWR